jgi:peptidyl-prolyl cis-trans isomerase C
MKIKMPVCIAVPVWAALSIFASAAIAADTAILASGSGISITSADFLGEIEAIPEPGRSELLADQKKVEMVVANMFVRRSLAKKAEDAKLPSQPALVTRLRLARDRVLAEAWLAKVDSDWSPPNDAALDKLARSSYAAEEKAYTFPEQRRVRHLLIAAATEGAEAKAKELMTKLRGGADFELMIKETSADPGSAKKGGDLGFFGRGRMIKPFEDAAFGMANPGDLVGPIETKFGWHILRLEEIKPAGKRPYEEVAEGIKRQIVDRLRGEHKDELLTPIRDGMKLDADKLGTLIKPIRP